MRDVQLDCQQSTVGLLSTQRPVPGSFNFRCTIRIDDSVTEYLDPQDGIKPRRLPWGSDCTIDIQELVHHKQPTTGFCCVIWRTRDISDGVVLFYVQPEVKRARSTAVA